MELKNKNMKQTEAQPLNFNLFHYHHAIEWWRNEKAHGKGNFNKELYEKILEIKFKK